MTIPQSTIDSIRDQTDIGEIVGQVVDLKRAGSNLKGLCPFHQEKTPSFNVNPERQIFHCFGCGKGGNVFTFLMEMEGVSFPEAVRSLGQRLGIEVEDRQISDEERTRKDRFYEANAFAARFYHGRLMDERVGKRAREYLLARDIPARVWRRLGLGFAPDSWDALWIAARRARLEADVLAELRLVVSREKSTGYYDYFRNRVIFPIIRPGGKVVGFGGRVMDDGEPKYLNSAESPVFNKRKMFYGLDRARDAIRSERSVVVVEGYTDQISLDLAGVTHSLAVLGTAFTPQHAIALRRMTQRVVLVPDGDTAGESAAVATGATLLAAEVEVFVVQLARGEDPDTAARSRSPEEFSQLVAGAVDYLGFLDYIVRERRPSPRQKEALIRRVASGLAGLENAVRRDVIAGDVAKILEVDADAVRAAARSTMRKPEGPEREASAGRGPGEEADAASTIKPERRERERLALRLIMEGTPQALGAMDSLDAEDLCGENHRKLYNLLDLARQTRIDTKSPDFLRRAEETGLDGLAAEIALISVPPGNVDALLNDTVRRIKRQKIEDELTLLREKLQDLPSDSEDAVAVAEYYHRLKQALVEL